MKNIVPLLIILAILVVAGILVFKGIKLQHSIGVGQENSFKTSQRERSKWTGILSGVGSIFDSIWGGK